MTASELTEKLGLTILSMPEPGRVIESAYAGDLLSWVMGRAKADCVWATIMTNINVIAVSSLTDASLTVICEDSEVPDEIISTAREKNVNLVKTSMPIYEFCSEVSKLI